MPREHRKGRGASFKENMIQGPREASEAIFRPKMTVPDPPCQPGPIFLARNAFKLCPMNSSTSFVFNSHLYGVFKASQTALKGQKWPKYHFFGHFWVCFVWFRKFSRIPIETREKCRIRKPCSSFRSPDRLRTAPKILLSWPISPLYSIHIYKKKFLTKIKCLKLISNHSMVFSGTYYNPFQGFFTHSGASGGLRSHILAKKWPFLTPPANPCQPGPIFLARNAFKICPINSFTSFDFNSHL